METVALMVVIIITQFCWWQNCNTVSDGRGTKGNRIYMTRDSSPIAGQDKIVLVHEGTEVNCTVWVQRF